MLCSSIGRARPAPRFLHTIRWAALALVAVCLPGLASAASVTFDVLDPSGFGATVTLEDGEVPGTLNIDIESFAPDEAILGAGDILGVFLQGVNPIIYSLDASGDDVDGVSSFAGFDPNRLVDLGAGGLFALNGIGATSFVYSAPLTETLSVEALAGTNLGVWIGFDTTQRIDTPGFNVPGNLSVIKPTGEIPVIPEPGTSALMLIGLIGLAATSRRLEKTASDA